MISDVLPTTMSSSSFVMLHLNMCIYVHLNVRKTLYPTAGIKQHK